MAKHRLDLYLDSEQMTELRKIKDETSRSIADLVREAVAEWLKNRKAQAARQ